MSDMTRRSFYVGAAAALAASRVMGANDRIRIGIVGLGGRGSDHVRAYGTLPDAQITALCDVNQPARERAQARLAKDGSQRARVQSLFHDAQDLGILRTVDPDDAGRIEAQAEEARRIAIGLARRP